MKSIRILSPDMHGALDYLAAVGLIVLPLVLGLEPLPRWLSVGAGGLLVSYSLLTDYALAAMPVFSFRTHLLLDGLAGMAFLAAPFALGFAGVTLAYFLVMGAGVLVVVALSATRHGAERRPPQPLRATGLR